MRISFAIVALACMATTSIGTGGRMVAVDSSRALYDIDINTGAKTQFGTVSANAGTTAGLAYDPVSQTVYLTSTSSDSLFKLDLTTGTATLIGPYDVSTPAIVMHGLEYDTSTGTLYGFSSHNSGTFYEIDKNTGAATMIGTVSGTLSFNNLGYNSDTNVMYMTSGGRTGGITDALHRVDTLTGAVVDIGPLGGSTNPNGLAYNKDNQKMYLVDNTTDTLYTINLTTGAATAVGSTGPGNLLGLAYIPKAVTATDVLPIEMFVVDGMLLGGTVSNLHTSNNVYVALLCDENDSNGTLATRHVGPYPDPIQVDAVFECKAARSDLSEFVDAYNYQLNSWENINFRTATLTDVLISKTYNSNPTRFVEQSSNTMNMRFRYIPQGDVDAADGWSMSMDLCKFIVYRL